MQMDNKGQKINENTNYLDCDKISLYTVGSFLIHLYDKLGDESYSCSQLKLDKMIILANLEYYKKYNTTMTDLELTFNDVSGFAIHNPNYFFRSPITISKKVSDEVLPEDKIKKLYEIKPSNIMYFDEKDILTYPKAYKVLISIFIKYASFSVKTLNDELNKNKEMIERIFFEPVKSILSGYKLSDRTINNMEKIIGISIKEFNDLSADEQSSYVKKNMEDNCALKKNYTDESKDKKSYNNAFIKRLRDKLNK